MKRSSRFLDFSAFSAGLAYYGYLPGDWRFHRPRRAEFPAQGVDVSHHQGKIDWNELQSDGLNFAYIKATEGGSYRDPLFAGNWAEASRAGLARGAYRFFTFRRSGKEQARNFVSTVPVDPSALPPAIDFKFAGNCADRPDPSALRKELSDFVRIVERVYPKRPVLYVANDSYNAYLKGKAVSCRLWVRNVVFPPNLSDRTDWTFWQYAENGHVKGMKGAADPDAFSGTKEAFSDFAAETIDGP